MLTDKTYHRLQVTDEFVIIVLLCHIICCNNDIDIGFIFDYIISNLRPLFYAS